MNVLEAENISKRFGGHQVLDGLTMEVPRHSVYGFLGINGAGKTTTMKIILGLLKADSGQVRVLGQKVRYGNSTTNRCIGYLPDVPEFYGYMSAPEYMMFCAQIGGLEKKYALERTEKLLAMTGLENVKKRIRGYSRGMKQRLGIAQALLGKPSLLICDEPTSALDPVGRKDILDILRDAGQETTVIFSTHILPDAERICDRAAILHRGRIVVQGEIEKIKERHGSSSVILETRSSGEMRRLLEYEGAAALLKNAEITENCAVLPARSPETLQMKLMKLMVDADICPARMEIAESSLENIFMEAVK